MNTTQKKAVQPKWTQPNEGPFKLDLACGQNKKEGFLGIDCTPTDSTDFVWNLTDFPWPVEDEVVDEIYCAHFFEHLTPSERMSFMDECHRIMKPATNMLVIVPYWSSMEAIQDPTHQWPPLCEASFYLFNREWRQENGMSHHPVQCHFDLTATTYLNDKIDQAQEKLKSIFGAEWNVFVGHHYVNAVSNLHVTLTKRV